MINKVKTVLIASGGGTDAEAIMKAYQQGFIPSIQLEVLISTKESAGCLEKARECGVKRLFFGGCQQEFNRQLQVLVRESGVKLIFLVGCIVKIQPIKGVKIYNIHPADLEDFGGQGMYGLKVHERVLLNVQDLIERGKKKFNDRFFTYPTVHEAVPDYDSGAPLLRANVEIPRRIISNWLIKKKINLQTAAQELQKQVLPYEWLMLPTAVEMAAKKILEK